VAIAQVLPLHVDVRGTILESSLANVAVGSDFNVGIGIDLNLPDLVIDNRVGVFDDPWLWHWRVGTVDWDWVNRFRITVLPTPDPADPELPWPFPVPEPPGDLWPPNCPVCGVFAFDAPFDGTDDMVMGLPQGSVFRTLLGFTQDTFASDSLTNLPRKSYAAGQGSFVTGTFEILNPNGARVLLGNITSYIVPEPLSVVYAAGFAMAVMITRRRNLTAQR
jgi:hypothetical protein